jgi:16S rRNA G1207 methylase RsmC
MQLRSAGEKPASMWQTSAEVVRGRQLTVWTKPGLFDHQCRDVSIRLLAETLEVGSSDVVLNLGAGAGLVGVVAGVQAREGRVILTTARVGEHEAAKRTLAENGVTNADVVHSSGISRLDPATIADVVAARLPKGRLPTLQCIWDAARAL